MIDVKSLYIDPGTGGMLFTVLLGVISVAVFSIRALYMKLRFFLSSDKSVKLSDKKIPIAIYSESKRYWHIFEPILDEFERRQQPIVYFTGSEDDPVYKKNYKFITGENIGTGNKAFSRLNLLNASVLLATTPSLDVFQWKRSKNVDCYILIPHAAKDLSLFRMYGTDHYDAFILSGEVQIKQVRQMEEIRGLKTRTCELCGVPYLDDMKKRRDSIDSLPSHERTVLLAPSWGESGILTRFGEKLIDILVLTGYKIIVRPHPQSFDSERELMDRLMQKYNDPSKVEWNRDSDNFDVLMRSDVLISDFSGVMFDFAMVFDKPIIYTDTKFDIRPYDADWIEEPAWTFRILPDLGYELNDNNVGKIKELIDGCIDNEKFVKGREKARNDIWAHIGEGAVRSADFVIKLYEKVLAESKNEQVPDKKTNNRGSIHQQATLAGKGN